MNGTLPGLLDGPNVIIPSSLSTRNDVHIPPLRNPHPAVTRNVQTLELIDHNYLNDNDRPASSWTGNDEEVRGRTAPLTHSGLLDGASAREAKKPHLAISELVDAPIEGEHGQVQLPSFVSLSVVERSPIQTQLHLHNDYPHKRPRLEADTDLSAHDVKRLLPRPIQKDDKHVRPLLPAMVTGLHEPPPSAALLPSIDLDARPALQRTPTSKMQVKDILLQTDRASNSRPPEQMLNTPEVAAAELPRIVDADTPITDIDTPSTTTSVTPVMQFPKKDPKVRRTRRKWTASETQDLLAGVKKHGFGKWKQILNDASYTFIERTSIDLKDRFRVFAKDYPDNQADGGNSDDAQLEGEAGADNKLVGGVINKQRRKRHPWTKEEDAALLHGVQQYGFQWTDIHNDADLNLGHRRATDLRDRIRNLYPDGYKHAEARPLRAEMKKAEKAGKKETPAGILYAPPGQMEAINFPANSNLHGTSSRNVTRRQTTSGKVPSIATLTRPLGEDDSNNNNNNNSSTTFRPTPRRSKTIAEPSDHTGITLPSLTLHNNANDADEWDNTLPPFIDWNEI